MPRRIHLLSSVLFHEIIVLLIVFSADGTPAPQSAATTTQKRQRVIEGVEVAAQSGTRPPEPEKETAKTTDRSKQPKEAMAATTESGRVDYAGAPQDATMTTTGEADRPRPAEEQPDVTPTESSTSELMAQTERQSGKAKSPDGNEAPLAQAQPMSDAATQPASADHSDKRTETPKSAWTPTASVRTATPASTAHTGLSASDVMRTDGQRVPEFRIEQFGPGQMDELVTAQQALCVAFCTDEDGKERMFAVRGRLQRPESLIPVQSTQLSRLSMRAIAVPDRLCRAVSDELRFSFGFTSAAANEANVRLLIANRLDAQILRRQREAAGRFGLPVEELRLTTGSLRFERGQAVDFEIHHVVRHGGETLSINTDNSNETD